MFQQNQHAIGAFKPSFLGFCLVLASVSGFLSFLERGKKGHFPTILDCFSFLFPKKPFLQNPSFLLVCLPLLLLLLFFCLPFQNSISACSFPFVNPFRENILVFFSPFLMCAPFLQANFPEIPFSNPSCFHFWLFGSAIVFLSALMVYVYVICYFLVFLLFWLCLLFCSQTMNETLFPCNSSVSWCLVGSSSFIFRFLFLLCCLLHFLKNEVEVFYVCVVFSFFCARLDSLLVWILLSGSFLFFLKFCIFVLVVIPSKNGHGTHPKNQTCRKKTNVFCS